MHKRSIPCGCKREASFVLGLGAKMQNSVSLEPVGIEPVLCLCAIFELLRITLYYATLFFYIYHPIFIIYYI